MSCKRAKYFIIISYLVFMSGCGKSIEEKDLLTQLQEQELVLHAEEVDLIESETQQFNVQTYFIRYKSDDCEVEAYVSVPNEYIASKGQYPCIVFNRGGNRDFSANTPESVSYFADFSNQIVVASQYRGGSGSTGQDEYGGKDVNDVIHLLDICEDLSIIDRNELYMMGVSRGGIMTYRAISQDKRIKKAVVISGVADLFLSYENRDDMKMLLEELIGGSPVELPEEYKKRSATYWAEEIKCPVLIIHSKWDEKVSYAEAEKMVDCLEKESKEYKFISYEDNVHGLHLEDFSVIMEWFGLQ